MRTKDFYFDLPEELIAQYPTDRRGRSRLMVLDRESGEVTHSSIDHIVDFIPEDALMIVNDSKVRKARVFAQTEFSGQVEFLFLEQHDELTWEVMVTKSKRQKKGRVYTFADGTKALMVDDLDGTRIIRTDRPIDESFFENLGHIPLPPYIKREDEFSDSSRYQTVYAEKIGSVAAPTAGLHFTDELLDALREKGVRIETVTLHVGLGTFLPIRTDEIEHHSMHSETYDISEETAQLINAYKHAGKPVIAVGTTSVRTLESAYDEKVGGVVPGRCSTDIFITPGYEFKVVEGLVTNFHTPESTLLILVSALAGREHIFGAYEEAIRERYRFYSYGDAMFIR